MACAPPNNIANIPVFLISYIKGKVVKSKIVSDNFETPSTIVFSKGVRPGAFIKNHSYEEDWLKFVTLKG